MSSIFFLLFRGVVFCAGLKAASFPKSEITEEVRGQAISLFGFLTKIALWAAVLGMPIVLGEWLLRIDLSEVDALKRWTIAMYDSASMLYCALFLIIGVFKPVEFILKKRVN